MSRCLQPRRAILVAWSFFLGSFLAGTNVRMIGADEVKFDDHLADSLMFRRVFVPADTPEAWPVGLGRFLPMSHADLARLVRQNRTQTSREPQLPVHVSKAVYHAKLLLDGGLSGTAEWTVESQGDQPRLLPLSPLNLAIESATWRRDPTRKAAVGLWKRHDDTHELAVLAEQSGTLQMRWKLAAREIDSARADYYLQKPIVVPQTFELLLPANHSATLSHAELLRSDFGPLGESRWEFQLAPHETHRLRINRPLPKQDRRILPLASQNTSYQLDPSGLNVVTLLRLDARESPIKELNATLSPGVRVLEVTLDQQPIEWRISDDAEDSTLVIHRPASAQPQSVEVRCLADFRSNTSWELPKLTFNDVAWMEGTTSLLVSRDLELHSLTPRQATLQHIVGIADKASEGEVFRLQEWSSEAAVLLEVGRPQPNLSAQTVTTIDLGRDEAQARIVARLSSDRSEVYRVQAELAAGWSIDSVSSRPKLALNEWHLDRREENSVSLYIQLNQPISEDEPLRIEIEARKIGAEPLLPTPVGNLKLVRFVATQRQHELLQLRTRASNHLVLPDRLERARLTAAEASEQLPPELRELVAESPIGALLDISVLSDAEVLEFRRQPAQYKADLQVEVETSSDSLMHRYQIEGHWLSGAVSEVLIDSDGPLPETLRWTIVGQPGSIAMERMDLPVRGPSQGSFTRYLLKLPAATNGDFRLQASYSQPAQPIEQCNIIRLPRAVGWSGNVRLRGDLERLRVFDQGWTPTVSSTSEADGQRLPVLGTYRLGPEEQRRRGATSGLRLERQTPSSPAPQLIAWLAEYHTLQTANGAALHTANYLLENFGTSEAKIVLPAGAELQEAWLDLQQLGLTQLSPDQNAYEFHFGRERRWPQLTLKYSTYDSPLGGTAAIQPALLECSFPVDLARWTLWAPEQYEIDDTQQDYSTKRYPWWKRLFGPLARSRGETVFNPLNVTSWNQLWSAPLVGQQTKQTAQQFASQIVKGLEANPDHYLGKLLGDLTDKNLTTDLIHVDRSALLAKGIQANTTGNELIANNRQARLLNAQALPLSSYRLALLVSPGTIVLTTAERVAHWHDQLRPTERPGLFVVSSDDLADHLDEICNSRSSELMTIPRWLSSPLVENAPWGDFGTSTLADVGRRAQTVEFIGQPPTLLVCRAYVQQALWYALVLLTVVLGVWQLAHYPNATIFAGAIAAAACLIVPPQWLTIPQAVFLGLVAAAIVRVAMKSSQFGDLSSNPGRKVARTTAAILLAWFPFHVSSVLAQLPTAVKSTLAEITNIPRVLIPIDSEGNQQGDEVYVSAEFLEKLQRQPRLAANDGAGLVILAANYNGKLPSEPEVLATGLAEPWTLSWKIETYLPNCRLSLPLRRDEAIWDISAHRLDGVPVKLDWRADGKGCSLVLPETGVHSLKIVGRPKIATSGPAAKLRFHVPPLPGATLDLAVGANVEDLQIPAATRTKVSRKSNQWQYVIGAKDTIELSWTSKALGPEAPAWEKVEQFSWLRIDPAAARLDVQLAVSGYQATSRLLELDVSAQLKLAPPGNDSAIEDVISPLPHRPTRLQLKLRQGLPADFVIPLRFDLQRAASVGRIYFPRVHFIGSQPAKNLFAVSVSAGLSYDEQVSSNLHNIQPAEFSASWDDSSSEPLYAYAIGKEDPDWSLRVWPDPQSLTALQSLRVSCLPNEARVDFEAVIDEISGALLSHRIMVPESLQIRAITVRDQIESNLVPVRWSRVSPIEVIVFLSRPLRHAHLLTVQGYVKSAPNVDMDLPRIRLLDNDRGEVYLNLYRTEDVNVSWTDPKLAPQENQGPRTPLNQKEILVGHYSWRTSRTGKLSKIHVERNEPAFEAASVATTDFGYTGWTARLNSRISVRQGVVSRLSLTVPANLRRPFALQPEQVGVIDDDVLETSDGKKISVLLSKPVAAGEEIELQFSGRLNLQADQRLIFPSLRWNGAAQQERYVLLPTLVEGRSLTWRTSGLKYQALPQQLKDYAPEGQSVLSFRVEQSQFDAKEYTFRGNIRKAQVRYAKVSGIVDADGLLTATAELVLQPGRAGSCAIQLPPNSEIYQLIVGDLPARRDLREDGSWRVPIGPPFMPQRIIVNYRSTLDLTDHRLRLAPPTILLGEQPLPLPLTWWKIRTTKGLQLGKVKLGRLSDEIQFAKNGYRQAQGVMEDALSQLLELPRDEGRAWAETWLAIHQQAQLDWQIYDLSKRENDSLSITEKSQRRVREAFPAEDITPASQPVSLAYPPRLPIYPSSQLAFKEVFLTSDSRGQLVIAFSRGAQQNLWRWFAAAALICGILAVALRLRHRPEWHHDLCRWPHSLSLAGGLAWWLLLKPSAIGMLVIVLALTSMTLKEWRSFRQRRKLRNGTQLGFPAS